MMVPDIWKTLYLSANLLTKQGDLYERMQGWSVDNGIPVNKLIRFSKQWFLDLMGMELAMGGGLCIMAELGTWYVSSELSPDNS